MAGDIRAWLGDLGFGKYAEAFVANDVDLRALPHLTDEDLKDIGVSLGHRRVIIAAAATLADKPAPEMAARKPVPSAQAERRQLTVMFCDLVGSTAIAEKLDPEDFGAVIRTFQETCVAAVTRFEGYVAKYLGDGILIYFGYPQAHEDDAERAVRAGLAILDALSGVEIDQKLQARIGVATGLVVAGDMVGEGVLEERAVLGETPNLAARLQALAEPNTVVIAPETHALVGETFEFVDLGGHTLKGFTEPVRAWQMTGTRVIESRFEAARGTGHTGLVGRETEIALLEERWRLAKAGAGQVVLVSGEAGIGKSRITQVLRERITEEPHLRLRYQCSPYYTNSVHYPFITQLEHAADFDRDDAGDTKLDKLEALLNQSATGASQVVPLFAALLSLPVDRYPPLNFSPERQKRETIAALADLMVVLAEKQPVLLVFEDVHWCDATSLEALGAMIDRIPNAAVLVVITYRPEFEPRWVDRDYATELALTRLSTKQNAEMVVKVTGGKTLPQEVLDQIVAKTDGIPLFVEELTKTVLEAGFLKTEDDAYVQGGPLPPLAIPATLQDSLTARLDRLSPVKEIAQVGACIGREFTHELIAAVSPVRENELQDSLQQLVNSELVTRHGETWTFKHALVRDAAYESLLRSRRQQLHNSIANALEDQFADQVANEPEIIAYHFTEAGLNERAVPYWHAAGARAVARTALPEAVSHLERSLSLNAKLPPSLERDHWELDTRILLATAYLGMFGWAAKVIPKTLSPASVLARQLGETDKLVSVLNHINTVHVMRCEFAAAAEIVEMLYSLRDADHDAVALVTTCRHDSIMKCLQGDFVDAQNRVALLLENYDFKKHKHLVHFHGHDPKSVSLSWGGLTNWALGWPDQAKQASSEQLKLARELEHPWNLIWALTGGTSALLLRGETSLVLERAAEALSIAQEHAMDFVAHSVCPFWAGQALIASGHDAEGLEQLSAGTQLWRDSGGLIWVPFCQAVMAQALTRLERPDEAGQVLEESLQLIEATGHRNAEAEVLRIKGWFLQSKPMQDLSGAERSYLKAIEVAQSQQAKGWELRTATSLARLWQNQGKSRDARECLAPVYDWFTEGFDTVDLIEARKLLEELS